MQGEHIADRRNGQRDERRHGQTHFALGAELGRDGMTAGLSFAAGMTTRASAGGSSLWNRLAVGKAICETVLIRPLGF